MRSFVYKEPHLWAEVLSGGFVCAGIGDTRKDAADALLEEYFEPYRLDGEVVKIEQPETTSQNKDEGKEGKEKNASITSTEVENSKDAQEGGRRSQAARSPSVSSSDDEMADAMADRMVELFRLFDTDGDGTIDAGELGCVLQRCDPRKWTDAKVNELLAVMDSDKDRRISYEEFVHWICGTVRWRKARKEFFKQIGVSGDELTAMKYAVHKRGIKHHGPMMDAASNENESLPQNSSDRVGLPSVTDRRQTVPPNRGSMASVRRMSDDSPRGSKPSSRERTSERGARRTLVNR